MSQSEPSVQGSQAERSVVSIQQRSPLEEALREGARQMLLQAIESEVADYVAAQYRGRRVMPLEGRRRHMVKRSWETSSAPRSGEPVETKLLRIARKARQQRRFQFSSLFHLLNVELLRGCFERLREDAAAGIDRVTKAEYAENLEGNLRNLVGRLQRMGYRPQPVRRSYIPKPGSSKQRPLGIPCLEDKLVQAGLVRILEQIYE